MKKIKLGCRIEKAWRWEATSPYTLVSKCLSCPPPQQHTWPLALCKGLSVMGF